MKSGAEMALDMNLEMEGLKKPMEDVRHSKELRVVYQDDSNKAPSPLSQTESEEDESKTYDEGCEHWRGSATASPAVRDAGGNKLLRAKTRSRLIDLQLIGFILIIIALICSLTIHKIQHQTIWGLHLWKVVVLVLVLISDFLLSGWSACIIFFFLEHNFKLRKRLLYFVYDEHNVVQNCIWLCLVLIAWQSLFDKRVHRENKTLSYITRILFCLIVDTVLRHVKTFMLNVLTFSFHGSIYFDQIQKDFFKQYIIQTLSGPPLIELQHKMEEDDRMEDGINMDQLHKLNQKNISAWNMKRLMRIVRHETLTILNEQITEESGEDESTL
ncbi:Mechanosensitive ion channel protein 8 [Dendrobium catenatum]|uniref:Mechanosensitive ion channel protein 8 n=1 Tax=Dendrobium catenatum TaxID=906689 RepID=A0A2I0XB39_9ASPA|nr:Mechanosensitive ion channel protein 8 [Dendrobium catenatum]